MLPQIRWISRRKDIFYTGAVQQTGLSSLFQPNEQPAHQSRSIGMLSPILSFSLTLSTIASVTADNMTLALVQVIWRHGDRSPTLTHPSDPIQENDWKFGGGGWGQLSPIGMKQHFNFGKQLRKRYVDTGFLSKTYNSKEIYVRSTDYNRTIISSMSNLLGMYTYNNTASVKGTDYPDVQGWPAGFIPIAVHTVEHDTDHLLIPHAPCHRMSWLFEMLRNQSDEVREYLGREDVKGIFANVTAKAGGVYDEKNIWEVRDVWKIEQVHYPERLKKVDWYSEKLYNKLAEISDKISLFDNGIYERGPVSINGLDVGLELQKIRGGSLINDLNKRMYMKYDCLNRQHEAQCRWIKNLKYLIYSAHDTTVFAFLNVMGIQSEVAKGEYPDYTAAAFVELYTNAGGEPYFKILYRPSDKNETIYSVTHFVPDCGGKEYCKLDVFNKRAERVKPDQNMIEWCEVNPWGSAIGDSSSTVLSITSFASILISYLWSHS
ncbi:unnamed protein product [Cylicocyclus nassatus]|uniref:Acid phosphatase n=1 Tax=Cylicocyclus nassatus TaxID=53992 RepID=A0AA36MD18_CYLNA|nr:unnamed protein product [Cylicocyclus nassatus]